MQKKINFLLLVLSFVLYGNSIQNDYNLDDEYVVGNNSYVQKGIAGIPEILTHRYSESVNITLDYRPVVLVSLAIEYQFFKDNPHVSHFVNILLYALCLIVLYNVLTMIFKLQDIHILLPVIITVFYGIHPLHTEVVNSLKNRDELFGFLFGMLFIKYGFSFFSENENRRKNAFTALTMIALSMLSKANGILYFPLLFSILLYYRLLKKNRVNYLFLFTSFLIISVIIVMIFYGLKRETLFFENTIKGNTKLWVEINTSFKIIFYHLKMLIYPSPLRFYYGHNMFPVNASFDIRLFLSFLLHAFLLIFSIRQIIRKNITGLFILMYLICLSIYTNFPIAYTGMFSERSLFLSSAWFIAAVSTFIISVIQKFKAEKLKPVLWVLAIIVFFQYSFMTIQRNFFWKNNLTLMTHDIKTMENSINGNLIYANNLSKESNIVKDSVYSNELSKLAIKYYKNCINIFPFYSDFHSNIATIYHYKLNDKKNALIYYKNVLLIDSTNSGALFQLGKLAFDEKNFSTSSAYFLKSYNSNPIDSMNLFFLAQSAEASGDIDLSFKANKEMLKLFPNLTYPYMNLGVYYSKKLKDDTAVIYFEKAIQLGERNPQLLYQMSIYFDKKNDKPKSKYYLDLLNSK